MRHSFDPPAKFMGIWHRLWSRRERIRFSPDLSKIRLRYFYKFLAAGLSSCSARRFASRDHCGAWWWSTLARLASDFAVVALVLAVWIMLPSLAPTGLRATLFVFFCFLFSSSCLLRSCRASCLSSCRASGRASCRGGALRARTSAAAPASARLRESRCC